MHRFGRNLKITIDRAHREKVRATLEALGATAPTSPVPHLDVFLIDGFSIGVFFVDPADALSPADQRKGSWLEFLVPDVEAGVKRLVDLGVERVEYMDKAHAY